VTLPAAAVHARPRHTAVEPIVRGSSTLIPRRIPRTSAQALGAGIPFHSRLGRRGVRNLACEDRSHQHNADEREAIRMDGASMPPR